MTAHVFIGPTLAAEEARAIWPDAVYMPPVRQGDVYRVVTRLRPDAIGIVDGYFAHVPSVWHKEILYALAEGVPVYGSASMGALRAAEPHGSVRPVPIGGMSSMRSEATIACEHPALKTGWGVRLTVKSGLDSFHHAALRRLGPGLGSSATRLAKHSALIRTSSAVVAQDVFSRRRALGYHSARLPVPPVQEAEAFRG
jgi:hypothetical protein